jgi:hypothetical protein
MVSTVGVNCSNLVIVNALVALQPLASVTITVYYLVKLTKSAVLAPLDQYGRTVAHLRYH